MKTRCGYVAVIGKPNAGKSAFLNKIIGQNLALVSHKANATRKKMNFILPYEDQEASSQIIFVDTPGLHHKEKLLNQFMLKEALRAHQDSDLILFFTTPKDGLDSYEEFLDLSSKRFEGFDEELKPKPHIILLNKIDLISQEELLKLLAKFQKYQDRFLAIIPFSVKKEQGIHSLLKVIHQALPEGPHLYDGDDLTTSSLREIYAELIRESVFENLSDEIPYESDVRIEKVLEGRDLIKIFAKIYVQKASQKAMMIGKQATTIKRISKMAREKIQALGDEKIYLELNVFVEKWSKDKDILKKFGYDFDL